MPIIGLTGGIATGKSTFAPHLLRELPMELFDSDRCVHDLLTTDDSIRDSILAAFGTDICNDSGRPDRAKLRELVFANESFRHQLENIIHPAIRTRWLDRAERTKAAKAWLLVDIPLLYETNSAEHFDRVIVVACHRETQIARVTRNRGLAPEMAVRILDAQLDLSEKIRQADHVIWNDSTVSNLGGQSRLLATWLRRYFA